MVEISDVWFFKVYSWLVKNMAAKEKNSYFFICFDNFFIDGLDLHYRTWIFITRYSNFIDILPLEKTIN